ncbi:SH3 domain-containing protein 3 [Linum grandiflorum]
MDALRKQASKLREQVSKQQQAMKKQFSGSGYESSDSVVIDEVELQRHQQLEKLYRTTRAGREFQKDIVRAAEALTAIGYKHIEAETKLSEDCCRYGSENDSDTMLAKAVAIYGDACKNVEKETEDLNRVLSLQVLEPLRAMITAGPLEDARHLAQRYSRMRQEAEAQAAELSKRQARVRESPVPENIAKWEAAEAKMQELKANMAVLGKEASAALAAVEAQQQRLTFQRLVSLVITSSNCFVEVLFVNAIDYHLQMVTDKQQRDSAPPVIPTTGTPSQTGSVKTTYFLAEATHPFHAETDKELSLAIGDFIVVRKVMPGGWSEGECKGKSGWFPSAFVERRQRIPTAD